MSDAVGVGPEDVSDLRPAPLQSQEAFRTGSAAGRLAGEHTLFRVPVFKGFKRKGGKQNFRSRLFQRTGQLNLLGLL